jgi:hypothetical protein
MTRLSSTRRAPGWLLGNSGSIADHARSESQNAPVIAPPVLFPEENQTDHTSSSA